MIAYTRDLGSMVDEVYGGIGVVAESYLLVHEYFIGKCAKDFGLLVLRGIRLGGVCGTTKGVVFGWAPVARLEGCLEGCCEGGEGESKGGEKGCELHFRFGRWWKRGRRWVGSFRCEVDCFEGSKLEVSWY